METKTLEQIHREYFDLDENGNKKIVDNMDNEEPLWPSHLTLDRKTGRLVSNDGLQHGDAVSSDDVTAFKRQYANDDEDGPLFPTGFNAQGTCMDCD